MTLETTMTVSIVVDTHSGKRVSQFYTRPGDAIRKAKQMRHGMYKHYKAYEYLVQEPFDLEPDVQEEL